MGKGIVKLGEGNWAVKDGNLLAAKETNGRFKNAEFTVARGTRATYVGRDGLIKDSNLQDANLVQNGDFEELSDDYIINPTFDTSIPFGTNGSGWKTIDTSSDNGTIEFFNGGIRMTRIGSNLKRLRATLPGGGQNVIPSTVETYKIQYEVISATDDNSLSGIYFGGASISASSVSSSVGVHTIYAQSGGSNGIIQFQSIPNKELVLDNISVKQVDPNDRWNVSSYDTVIEDGVAKFPTTNGSFLIQSNVVPASVKQYKLQYDVVETNGGNLRLSGGSSAFGTIPLNSSLGTHTFYLQSNGAQTNLQFNNQSSFVGSIDNVVVQEIKTDTPRIDFTDNTDGHLLLEPTSTNIVPYSEDFSQSVWTKTNSSVISGFASPDGTNNAYSLIENTSTGEHFIQSIISASNSTIYTTSIFVKYAGREWIRFTDAQSSNRIHFNTQTGQFGAIVGTVISYNKTALDNGWYKLSFTTTSVATAYAPRLALAEADNDVIYTGNGTSGVYIWGAQVEALSYPTSYIPTNGSTVTRDADTCKDAGEAIDFSSEGVLYAEIAALANSGTWREINLDDGSTNNAVEIRYKTTANQFQFVVRSGGTAVVAPTVTISNPTEFMKVAFSYKTDDCKMYINGVEVATDTSGTMPSGLNHLSFDWGGTNPFHGKCKAIKVYKEALSDSELTTLTS